MRCDKCGWYRPKHAVCEFDDTLTEPYESCLNWKPITNADRLDTMTVEEKAEWFEENATGCPPSLECYGPGANPSRQDCIKCWLDWLNKTASDTYWLDWLKGVNNGD